MALNSCKKADNNTSTNVSITGKWYDVSDTYTVTNKSGITTPVDVQPFNHTVNVTFNSDGSGFGSDSYFSPAFTYTATTTNFQLTQTVIINSKPTVSVWNVPIKQLTSTTLELYFVIVDASDGHSENHDVIYTK